MKLAITFGVAAIFLSLLAGTNKGDDSTAEFAMKYLVAGLVATAIVPFVDAGAKRRKAERLAAAGEAVPGQPKKRWSETRDVIDVHLDRGEALERALDAVGQLRRVTIREVDREAGTISAVTGPTFASIGEKIHVSFSEQGDGRLRVEISSLSKMAGGSADRAKNDDNVQRIADAIQLGS
jgi:hypothetical protein